MPPPLVLAIDLGTSSTRTALFDHEGLRLPRTTSQQTYPLYTTLDGGAELEPAALLGAVRHCLEQTLRVYRTDAVLKARPIAGIGMACFWHSLVGLDDAGCPSTAVLYRECPLSNTLHSAALTA